MASHANPNLKTVGTEISVNASAVMESFKFNTGISPPGSELNPKLEIATAKRVLAIPTSY